MLTYTTYASSTVGVLYTAGDLALQVAAGEGGRFPTNGDFWIRIGNPQGTIRKCTARVGDLLTLEAGAKDGTVDAGAAVGLSVDWVLSAEALNQLRADLVQTGTYAAKPAAAAVPAGTLYLPQDSVYDYLRSTGAAWQHFKGGRLLTPPALASFAWVNQGGATAVDTYGGIYLSIPAGAGQNVRMLTRGAPATPYTYTVQMLSNLGPEQYNNLGLVFRQSADGKLVQFVLCWYGSAVRLRVLKMTNPTTFSAAYLEPVVPLSAHQSLWLQIADDGVNRYCRVSGDNLSFHPLHSVARADFLTADQIGLCGEAASANQGPGGWFLHEAIG